MGREEERREGSKSLKAERKGGRWKSVSAAFFWHVDGPSSSDRHFEAKAPGEFFKFIHFWGERGGGGNT